MNVQVAPQVKLTLPILQEVNVFSRLQLRKERVNEIPCFSEPVLTAWCCNPTKNPTPDGKDPDKDFCSINWICKVYYAGRLGVGLKPDEPYNFEKAKEFAKALGYEQLLQAIHEKETQAAVTPPEQAIVASQIEAAAVDQDILAKKAEAEPVTVTKTKGPPAAPKADKPKATSAAAIHGFNPGTLGHWLLASIPEDAVMIPHSQLWKAAQEKGFNSAGRFNSVLAKLITDGFVNKTVPPVDGGPTEEHYTRLK
jgi:hypothetical protein